MVTRNVINNRVDLAIIYTRVTVVISSQPWTPLTITPLVRPIRLPGTQYQKYPSLEPMLVSCPAVHRKHILCQVTLINTCYCILAEDDKQCFGMQKKESLKGLRITQEN